MWTDKKGRVHFVDGYERMACLTIEFASGRSHTELAEWARVSRQRVEQIVKAGYGRAGCKRGAPVAQLAAGFATADTIRRGPPAYGTPEWFYRYERFKDKGPE